MNGEARRLSRRHPAGRDRPAFGASTGEPLQGAGLLPGRAEPPHPDATDGRVKTSKGLGPALETTILNGIELLRRSRGQRLIHHAGQLLEAAEYNLRRSRPELTVILASGVGALETPAPGSLNE